MPASEKTHEIILQLVQLACDDDEKYAHDGKLMLKAALHIQQFTWPQAEKDALLERIFDASGYGLAPVEPPNRGE